MERSLTNYPAEKLKIAKEHLHGLVELKGENIGPREFRGQAAYYLKGVPHSARTKVALNAAETEQEMIDILTGYWKLDSTNESSCEIRLHFTVLISNNYIWKIKEGDHIVGEKQQPSMNDQLRVRREKMQELRDKGIDPFGHRFERTHLAAQLHEKYGDMSKEEIEEQGVVATVAGRMVSKRGKGKVGFADLKDRSGKIQLYVRKDELGEDVYKIFKRADLGDFLGVTGT